MCDEHRNPGLAPVGAVDLVVVTHVSPDAPGSGHVYSMVVGHQVDHLHQHLVPRYPGTPREYWWPPRFGEWPDARLGGRDDVTRFVHDLRALLAAADG